MTLFFKILKRAKPGKKSSEGMVYYPYPKRANRLNLDDIAEQISKQCTVSGADVHAVLYALVGEITEEIGNGNIVELGRLGTFKLNLKSDYKETPEEVNASCIVGNHVVFSPSTYIKKKLKTLKYRKGK